MCGIVGILSKSPDIDSHKLKSMRDTMIHRGPDGGGLWISESQQVGFGHRRLSILDLSTAASQPMSNKDDSVCLTYNGEVYNFAEIKAELKPYNYEWKTDHSDTEVILHSYEQWGIEFIKKLRGQFAFAIWDENLKKCFIVRDRAGIKPLYYTQHNEQFIFASEIKAIIEDRSIPRHVNEKALYHYLTFLTSPPPETLFKGIFKLPAAHYMEISINDQTAPDIKITKYWELNSGAKKAHTQNEDEIINTLREKLFDSVKTHKISDVSSGVFLSGGIDSSLNAVLFSKDEDKPTKTFTITYDDKNTQYKSEAPFARIIANKIKADHYEHQLTVEDMLNFLRKMVYLQDEPIADPVCVPVYYVSKLAKDNNVTVCHVGEGSDELFWGYPGWKTSLNNQKLDKKYPFWIKKILLIIIGFVGKKNTYKYELLRRAVHNEELFWGGAEVFTEAQKENILSKSFKNRLKKITSWSIIEKYREDFSNSKLEKTSLNWMTYLDLNFRLPELLLMRVDKMSMGVSIETRVPFLDYKFVEFAMSIPESMKTKNSELKYILKKASEGIIPNEIIYRDKQGFGVPLYDWFFGKLGEEAEKIILNFIKKTDYFNLKEIKKMIKGREARLWYILNLALWWETFINVDLDVNEE